MSTKVLVFLNVLVLAGLALIVGIGRDEPLRPSVEQALNQRFPLVAPEDNIYVGLAGLPYLEDGDVVTAGKKYYQNAPKPDNAAKLKQVYDFSYANPCQKAETANCLDQIEAESEALMASYEKNRAIVERYLQVQKMPLYVNNSSYTSFVPQLMPLIGASRLIGAKALLDIRRGDVEGGLAALEADLAFLRRIGQSSGLGLMDLTVILSLVNTHLTEISKIIEDDRIDLTGREDRLRKILELDFNFGSMMTAFLTTEKRHHLQSVGLLFERPSPWPQSFLENLQNRFFLFLTRKNLTRNMAAARFDQDIREMKALPLLDFPKYLARRLARGPVSILASNSRIKALYDKYGLLFFKNYGGERFAAIAEIDHVRYAALITDVIVYSRLVRAQLELRLMPERPEDVSAALAQLGPETWNSYTGQPFEWDHDQNVILAERALREPAMVRGKPSSPDLLKAAVPLSRP